jgi:hypothetical protein
MIANALPRPLTAGSVDNAILRADGTGGTILQSSGLIVDDAIVAYSATGDAATDVITATGHIYTANQTVIFTAITGGAGLSANTVYFVRNPSGNTFQLSTTSGGAAINFTTNITSGSVIAIQANVAISQNTTETNSALVLTPKGTGAFVLGPKPNGTVVGGNARGNYAVDLQIERANTVGFQVYIASGANSGILAGKTNAAQGSNSVVCGGFLNAATANDSFVAGGNNNTCNSAAGAIVSGTFQSCFGAEAVVVGGRANETSGSFGAILGGWQALANRFSMQAHASGQFSAKGDAQRARFVLRNKTTTNSAVELFLNTADSTRLTIPSGKVVALTINIAGISSTGAAVAHYMRQYALKNVSGTCTEVYAPVTIGTDNAAGTSIALSASDASDALIVSVTGTASTIWRWVASVDAVEIAFGT